MLVLTIYGHGDDQKFIVHHANEDGSGVTDVTPHYEVHALTCEDARGLLVGWHLARREPKPPCMHMSTAMFVDGWAVCFECGAEVDEHRRQREGKEL